MVNIRSLFIIATAALAAATPVLPRDSHDFKILYSDFLVIGKAAKDLGTATVAYKSGTADTAPIFKAFEDSNAAYLKAAVDCSNITILSNPESIKIADFIVSPYLPTLDFALGVLDAKKTELIDAGLREKIIKGLKLIISGHDTLTPVLPTKLTTIGKEIEGPPDRVILANLNSTIENFSN